jgi:hypothetical protein
MLTAETGFSAPTVPNTDPFAAFPPEALQGLSFAELNTHLGSTAEIHADVSQISTTADNRSGIRTTDGYVAIFRTGQVVHVSVENASRTTTATRSQYMGHDGVLRDYDADAEFLPFEVRTFRLGLAERFGQPADERYAFADGADIGVEISENHPAFPAEAASRPGRLRRLGRFALNEVKNAASSIAGRLRSLRAEDTSLQSSAEPAATAAQPGRHRYNPAAESQVNAAYAPSQYQRLMHTGRHRRS